MKWILAILILTLLHTIAFSQRICNLDDNKSLLSYKAFQSILKSEQQVALTVSKKKQILARGADEEGIINIPVVVHIIYNTPQQNISEAQIISQIEALNKDFSNTNDEITNRPAAFKSLAADTKIRFCLSQVAPDGKRTRGIVRKHTSLQGFTADDMVKASVYGDMPWDSKKYLNIWVCPMIGRSLGYSSLPGSPAELDGIVIAYDVFGTTGNVRAPFNKGRTTTHEVGHWLGLKHIWGDNDCGDDNIDDTPPQKTYNFGCPVFPHTSTCSINSNGDMFMNFMDFSDDACMNMFTDGQKNKMRALFEDGNARSSFLTSFACDSNLAVGPLPEPEPTNTNEAIINIYPNPVLSITTIEINNVDENYTKHFSISNSIGIKVYDGVVKAGKNIINITSLPSGIYILRINDEAKKKSLKIIKK